MSLLRVPPVRVAGAAGCERIHKGKKMQRAKFVFTLQEWKGALCGDAPAMTCRDSEFVLDHNRIMKGWGGLLLCGPWAVGGLQHRSQLVLHKLQFTPILSCACGCGAPQNSSVLFLLPSHFQFQSWGHSSEE